MSFKEKFKTFPILETERLILRQLNQDDAKEFLIINSDPEVLKYMGTDGTPKNVNETTNWIVTTNSRFYKHRSAFVWAIAVKSSDRAIGYKECRNFY